MGERTHGSAVSRAVDAVARRRVATGFTLGVVALWLATPTPRSLVAGGIVALVGQALRIWAAGHLEKGREVTRSGPYRWMRHPLYVGSAVMAAGLAIAAADAAVAAIVAIYLVAVVAMAARREDAWLHRRFGDDYVRYRDGGGTVSVRSFSLRRALVTNREHRAVAGLVVAASVLALKLWI